MTRRTERIRRNRHFRLKRDTILFGVGILGIGYETLAHQAERPTLLLLFAAMGETQRRTMCEHEMRFQGLHGGLVDHARHCYPRTTAYIAVMVTLLFVLTLLELMGVFR
jgi:hypothetical protein